MITGNHRDRGPILFETKNRTSRGRRGVRHQTGQRWVSGESLEIIPQQVTLHSDKLHLDLTGAGRLFAIDVKIEQESLTTV